MLLSVDVWTGASAAHGGSDNWSNGGNWSLGAPPGASDTADFTNSQYNAAYVDVAVKVAGLTVDDTWNGTITVAKPLTVTSNFSLAGGTFGGPGAMSISGLTNQWSAGTIDVGSGGLILTKGSLLALQNPNNVVLEGGGTFADDGTIDQYNTGWLLLGSPADSTTTLAIASGATYDFRNNSGIGAAYFAGGYAGLITNAGIIYKTAGTGTSTISADPLTNTNDIIVGTGTLALATNTTATGGTYAVAGGAYLDLTGDTSSTFTITGTFTGQNGGTILLDDGDLVVGPGGATFDDTVNTGVAFRWSGGAIDVPVSTTLTYDGTLTITNAGTAPNVVLTGGGSFVENGTIDQSNTGNLEIDGTSTTATTLVIPAGSTYNIEQTDADILQGYNAGGIIVNAGTVARTGGTGESSITTVVESTGAITVDSGTLTVATAADSTFTGGTYTVASGAFLDLTGGNTFAFTGTFTGAGSGTLLLDSGDLLIGTGGATFDIPSSLTFQWSGGTITVPVNATLTYKGTLTQVASNDVVLDGGGTFVLGGTVDQTGAGSLQIDGTSTVSTTLDIAAGSVYDCASDSGVVQGYNAGGVVDNAGTIEKTGGQQTSYVTTVLNSSGALSVSTGTLALATAGGTNTGGTFTVAGGAILDLTGGNTVSYTGTYTGSGAGEVVLSSGTLTVVGGTNGATFSFPNGLFRWNGGTINTNNSRLTIAAGKSIDVNGFAGEVLTGGGTLQVSGTINDSGVGNIRIDDGTTLWIVKGGTFDLQTDAGIEQGYGAGGLVLNAGTLEKTVGTNVSTISTPLNNTGTVAVTTGVLDITGAVEQVTGTTLEAGTWTVTSTATVQSTLEFASPASLSAIGLDASVTLSGPHSSFPNLAGITSNSGSLSLSGGLGFTTAGSFSNSGMLTLNSGDTLTVKGNYTQTSTGTLSVTIDGRPATGDFGQVDATGPAALAGTLSVTVSSGFTPTVGDVYPIVTYSSETGTFATIKVSGLSGSLSLIPAYNAKDFTLTVASASSSVPATASAIGPLAQLGPSESDTAASPSVPASAPPPAVVPGVPQAVAASTTSAKSTLSPSKAARARRAGSAHPGHARVFHAVRQVHRGAGDRPGAPAEIARPIISPTSRTSRNVLGSSR